MNKHYKPLVLQIDKHDCHFILFEFQIKLMINSIKNKNHLIVIISSVQITHLEQHDCVLVDVSATAIDVINIHSFFYSFMMTHFGSLLVNFI